MRLIDTNVIVYAVGKSRPLRESSRRILSEIATGTLPGDGGCRTLQEVRYVYSSRNERRKGFETLDDLLVLFPNPIAIARDEVEAARDLMRQYSFLGARDAIHGAVVQTHNLDGIVTADKVFERIKGIRRFAIK